LQHVGTFGADFDYTLDDQILGWSGLGMGRTSQQLSWKWVCYSKFSSTLPNAQLKCVASKL
jgi:hypothetical protein